MIGKYDRFCEMKCRFLRVSRNLDYFHLFSYLNESHFELNAFSFTGTQFNKYTTDIAMLLPFYVK